MREMLLKRVSLRIDDMENSREHSWLQVEDEQHLEILRKEQSVREH